MKEYAKAASAVEKKETALFLVIRGHSAIYVSVRLKGTVSRRSPPDKVP